MPQAVPALVVACTLAFVKIILMEASLSFLGLGVQPPNPSLGNMLIKGKYYVWETPGLVIYPGLILIYAVVAFTFLGEAIRQLLDPTQEMSESHGL